VDEKEEETGPALLPQEKYEANNAAVVARTWLAMATLIWQ